MTSSLTVDPFSAQVEFDNQIVGTAIPAGYISSIEKGFREACNSGALIGYPVEVNPNPEMDILRWLTSGSLHIFEHCLAMGDCSPFQAMIMACEGSP